MSYSGGVFSINTTGQPVVAGTTISASVFNALTADLATGLSTCILKDGTQTTTAAIPFALGIAGVTTNSSAAAGVVGEFIDSLSGNVSTTGSVTNITSISLTAGDWDVSGAVSWNGTTGVTWVAAYIGTTSASSAGTSLGKDQIFGACDSANGVGAAVISRVRISISGTTTYYLNGRLSGGTQNTVGYISARRVR